MHCIQICEQYQTISNSGEPVFVHYLMFTSDNFILHRKMNSWFLKKGNRKYEGQLNLIGFVSTNDKQTPSSILIPLSWKMRNVLKRMKKLFSDFYFSSYHGNSKNKIGKNLIFLSIQPIPDLSCKFDHFWIFYFDVCIAYPCRQNTEAWLGEICRWR